MFSTVTRIPSKLPFQNNFDDDKSHSGHDRLEWKWRRKTCLNHHHRKTRNDHHYCFTQAFISMLILLSLSLVCNHYFEFIGCEAFQLNQSNHCHSTFISSTNHFNNNIIYTTSMTNRYVQNTNQYYISYHHSKFSLYMGKGDGKKKRKKKSISDSSTLPSSSTSSLGAGQNASPPPLRVTSDSIIPVRRQIMWAQMKKEAAKNSGTSFRQSNVKRTSYRKSLDEEEIEQARIERQKRGQDVDWDVILNATASTPLVIVDGYNIIHKYPRLKKWMTKGMLSKARNMLIHDMEELRALKGWRIEVVFDGYGKDTNGPLGDSVGTQITREKVSKSDQEASKKVTDNGVRVVFSGAGMSADNYIEQRCFEAKKVTDGQLTGSLIVATDDNLIRSAGASAGAVSMGADRLIDELRALRKATMYRVEVAVAKANGHAIRPPQLMGKVMPSALNRGSIIIEDKRNRPKKERKDDGEQSKTLEDLKKGTTSLPSWAVMPPKDPNVF